jgi:hypothetical protein
MAAANICPANFLVGDTGSMSSFAPIRKIMIKAHRMYCRSSKYENGVQSMIEKMVPANIAIPPKEGVTSVWALLSPGTSYNFFFFAILIIEGIARKVNEKAVTNARIISYIRY